MENQIECPHCHQIISVEAILSHQIEERIQRKFNDKLHVQQIELKKRDELLKEKEIQFELTKKRENEIFLEKVQKEKDKIREEEEERAKKKSIEEVENLKKMLQQQQVENQKLQQLQIDLIKKDQEIIDIKNKAEQEAEKRLIEQKKSIEGDIRKRVEEESEQKFLEIKKQNEDLKKSAEELKRKAEQGSMQLQGEVQELKLEEMLQSAYPYDIITPVAKGIKGADCIQEVFNEVQQSCGKIIFESKITKTFDKEWINKLKADKITANAEIAILVTKMMPMDMDKFGFKDGIWICNFSDVKSLVYALRLQLINVNQALSSQENKGEKMNMMYSYITSNEFKSQIEAIADSINSIMLSTQKERIAMEKLWKEREKQVEHIFLNTSHIYGSLKGIVGNAIASVNTLELGE